MVVRRGKQTRDLPPGWANVEALCRMVDDWKPIAGVATGHHFQSCVCQTLTVRPILWPPNNRSKKVDYHGWTTIR